MSEHFCGGLGGLETFDIRCFTQRNIYGSLFSLIFPIHLRMSQKKQHNLKSYF